MQPDDNRHKASIVVPSRQSTSFGGQRNQGRDQAADVLRGQIDAIYNNDPAIAESDTSNQGNAIIEPQKADHQVHHQIQASAWQKYHTAWQSYYQQYYERYYMGQVEHAKRSLQDQTSQPTAPTAQLPYEKISTNQAMYDLRSKLRGHIKQRASKVRKSRHFVPITAASLVMLIFLFLQYNRILFANVEAYVIPSNLDPSTIIVDPNTTVGPEARLIIPSINVDAPIILDAVASSQDSLNQAMNNGVVWFNIPGANAKPGEVGNFVLSGHSSNDWLDGGGYKFIFARLEQLKDGDVVYVNYNSVRYTYTINTRKVVEPTDVKALVDTTTKPLITLITCVPLGTANNRLLVTGEQVSPNPADAKASQTATDSSADASTMPSNSPTFLERLFGQGD